MKESEKNLMGCVVARNQWGGNNEKKKVSREDDSLQAQRRISKSSYML